MALTNAMAEPNDRSSSTLNPKIHSDSGYGSNKSNSQSQRSSGSSKSQQSSLSSGSGTGYPVGVPVSNADCSSISQPSPAEGSSNSRQSKKKNKLDRRLSTGEKNETRLSLEEHNARTERKGSGESQPMDLTMPGTPSNSKASSTQDSKALQVAALTHALSYFKKFQQETIPELEINDDTEGCVRKSSIKWQEAIPEEYKVATEDAFATVVSLDDGVVVYLTPSISNILGFPKDMLIGRSFIDFVHPKDRMAFASHITCGINFPIDQNTFVQNQGPTVKSEPFYCRLRQYRGLKTGGFGVTDKTVIYKVFKLNMHLKKVETPAVTEISNIGGMTKNSESFNGNASMNSDSFAPPVQNAVYLVIGANQIKSEYQYSEEIPKNPIKFVTRHSASCHYGHMDEDAISYLGYLPQDLIGSSVLDYYHPEDMTLMKDIYEAVLQEKGRPFRSKPYRFRICNGTFATIETDWSSFINPWSLRLEFVIGQHRVVQGPENPNVFMPPNPDEDETLLLSDEIKSDGKEMQNEIRRMLTETITRKVSDPLRSQSSRRRKDLAALMETLLEQMKTENSKTGSQCSGFSVMEMDSAMLGEISPHTIPEDNSESNLLNSSECSSSTPPSYNQLNYRENIERFFQSQPKTDRSEESGESLNKMDAQNQSSESDSSNIDYSSGSNIRHASGASNESGNDHVRDIRLGSSGSLTQELITRHNEDMEKNMIQRHKDTITHSHKESRHRPSENLPYVLTSRSMDDSSDVIKHSKLQRSKKCLHKSHKCDVLHGTKRTGNFSYDGDYQAKHPHLDGQSDTKSVTVSNGVDMCNSENSINLWPPFSISMTPGITTSSYSSATYGISEPPSVPSYSRGLEQASIPRRGGQDAPIYTHSNTQYKNAEKLQSAAPLFVPGQQQFLPHQQVQLKPAGMVYQPISNFGQHPQILMPLGIHPGQSIFLGNSSSVMPSSSMHLMTMPTTTPSVSVAASTSYVASDPKVSIANSSYIKSQRVHCKSSSSRQLWNVDRIMNKVTAPHRAVVLHSKMEQKKFIEKEESSTSSTFSGSDEGMTFLSENTKSFKEDMDQDLFTSDQSMYSESNQEPEKIIRNKAPPWMEEVSMTPELSFRYTLPMRNLKDILEEDLQTLKKIGKQSPQVNDQLTILYKDLTDTVLYVDEGISDSSCGEEQLPGTINVSNIHQYSRVAIFHEENAPFPSENLCGFHSREDNNSC